MTFPKYFSFSAFLSVDEFKCQRDIAIRFAVVESPNYFHPFTSYKTRN